MMKGFRGPVWQVKADDRSGTYRAVYVVNLPSAMYVLHTFQKKSTDGIETRRADLELVQRRLRVAMEMDAERSGQ